MYIGRNGARKPSILESIDMVSGLRGLATESVLNKKKLTNFCGSFSSIISKVQNDKGSANVTKGKCADVCGYLL